MSTGAWSDATLSSNTSIAKWEKEVLALTSNASNSYLATAVNLATATDPITALVTSQNIENDKGVLEIIGVVNTTGYIKDGQSLTIKMYDSADDDTYAEIHYGQRVYYKAASGSNFTLTEGDVLFRWVVPTDAEDYIKCVITSAATNTGKIDIYTLGKWADKIELAKDQLGVDLSRMLMNVKLDANMNYADGDVLLDIIYNPDVFATCSDFKTLELIYLDLSDGNRDSPHWQKMELYKELYNRELPKAWSLKILDVDLDDDADFYNEDTPAVSTFIR